MQNHAVDPFGIVGQVLDGQFRVDRLVGEGGFSAVYRGFHLGLQEPIAVKCLKLPPSLSPPVVDQFAQRFRDESRILYRLSQGNLNVVRSIAAGTWQTNAGLVVPYMILEWLEGRSLANELTIRRTVGQQGRSLEEVVQLFAPAADGLGYAHSQGVVHRDVNPGNLFLASTAQGTRMKVLDFGVAKILDESTLNIARMHTVGQIRIFAPAYGAPEQFDDSIGQVGAASDVYAFALILLEAMRDRTVNEGAHLGEFAQRAIDPNRRPTPRSLGLEVPDEVEQIFARATKLDPRERWQNARELWQALSLATNAASQHRHAQAAAETPSLGMPPGTRSTRSGVAPPPEVVQAAVAAAAKPGRMDKTMPLGAVFPKLDFPAAPGIPTGTAAPTERQSDPLPSFPLEEGSQPSLGGPEGAPAERRGLAGTLMMTPGQGPSPAAAALAAVHEAQQQRAKTPLATTMPFTGPQGNAPGHAPAVGPTSGNAPSPWEAPPQGYPPPGGGYGGPPGAPGGGPPAYAQPVVPPSNPNPSARSSSFGADRPEQASMLPGSAAGVPSSGKSPVLFIAIGLGVLAVIGVVLAGISVLGGKSPAPAPSASASAAPTVPPVASSAAPEPPPTAAATASAAPTATEEPEEPKVEDAGAAPSASAKPATPDVAPTAAPTTAPTTPATAAPMKSAAPAVDPNAFSETAARAQLSQANGILVFCKKQGGVTGPGTAAVTFNPDGSVVNVAMDPPYAGTPAGECVSGHFRRTKVKAFSGPPKTLKHAFEVPK